MHGLASKRAVYAKESRTREAVGVVLVFGGEYELHVNQWSF
jgi:hypothetical protein